MIGLNMIDSSLEFFCKKSFDFSLNLTEAELENKSFSKWVASRLAFFKIDPKWVTFEILEDISFSVNKYSVTTIKELKEIGCLIAQGIVDLSHRIGAKVVAEFVSRQEIQDIVIDLGIECSEGYLFAEPLEHI
jgi:EAL domain-containing protein (putative c-di-GMP-specific phosphodiesterase class I)